MTDLTPAAATLPGVDDKRFYYYRVAVSRALQFTLAIDAGAKDPISLTYAEGAFVNQSLVHLMLQLTTGGDTVLDLGAHIGTFTLAAAAAGRRVIALEASPANVALVRASIARNGFDQARVIHAAVSSRPGILEFCPHGPFGCVRTAAWDLPSIRVPAVAVDSLLEQLGVARVDFIKMDVEGSEMEAIRGMSGLLARPDAPPILFESNGHTLAFYDQTPRKLLGALEDLGYRHYYLEDDRILPFRSDDFQPVTVADFLAVKRPVPKLEAWRIDEPLNLAEQLHRVIADCKYCHEHQRAYMARALAAADASILTHPAVAACLDALQTDPVAAVRSAAAWWPAYQSWPNRLKRKLLARRGRAA